VVILVQHLLKLPSADFLHNEVNVFDGFAQFLVFL
jgi:hypothetical protein